LAVGISLTFLGVSIAPAASLIGLTTLFISIAGMKIGSSFGARFKSKAEAIGGLILVLIGIRILFENLSLF
jgi:putative Mn2+ efflux pump MntP